jgi:DNA-directed RNA polymerase subunit RPC12/RpoP
MELLDEAGTLALAVVSLIDGNDEKARAFLRRLPRLDPVPPPPVDATAALERVGGKRVAVPSALRAQTSKRDRWQCRYCGRRVVVPGVIQLVGALCPLEFPFPSHNMPGGRTHPAAVRLYPNVDHVHAGSIGGWLLVNENLVTACTRCNELKSDKLGWSVLADPGEEWDGLAGSYKALWERAGDAGPYHRRWFTVLGL